MEVNPVNKTTHVFTNCNNVVAYKQFNPAYVTHFQKTIPVFKSISQLEQYLLENENTFVISREKYWFELEEINLDKVASAKDTFESPTTIIAREY